MAAGVHVQDAELVALWRGGDRRAASQLVERHIDAVTRFFTTKAGDRADDLVQRTFLRVAESFSTYRGDASFRAWLFGVARHVLFEHLRSRLRDARNDDEVRVSALVALDPRASTLAAVRAEQRALVRALQDLPVDVQILLELYYWEDLSVDEIAAVLGVPSGTVKGRLFRARGLLKDRVEAAPGGDAEEAKSLRLQLADWLSDVRARRPT